MIDKRSTKAYKLEKENKELKKRIKEAIEYIYKLQKDDDIEIWRENGYWAYILHLIGSDK